MASYVGRRRAPARSRHLVRRVVLAPAALGLGITAAVASSATAHSSTLPGAIAGVALPAPTAFSSLHPASADAARAAETLAAAEEQSRQSRQAAMDLASRAAATRSAVSAGQARKEEKERAERAARKAAAERKAAAAKAKRVAKAHRWVLPIAHPNLSSPFGHRWGRLHAGLDFSTPVGTPLVAMSSGVVTKAEYAGGYGLKVEIRYWDGTVSYFAHMSEVAVETGDAVRAGTYVGKSGNTGNSTGPHLHLEIHPKGGDPTDPAAWLTARHVRF